VSSPLSARARAAAAEAEVPGKFNQSPSHSIYRGATSEVPESFHHLLVTRTGVLEQIRF